MPDRVWSFEVIATGAPRNEDARHPEWLKARREDRFAAGVLLNGVPRVFSSGERLLAAPLGTLLS